MLRRLLPEPAAEVEAYHAYRPARPLEPLVRVNMVASADGRATDEQGHSEGLGGAGDQEVFRALRALADGVLAGAGTVRAEDYGPHRLHRSVAGHRRADGRGRPAAMVVVSRSLRLDPRARVFTQARTPTVVLTCSAAPADRREALARVARVVEAGKTDVDLTQGIALLRERFGIHHLLVEGGPTLNGGLLDAGLVDELCLTVASQLVGGQGPGVVVGAQRGRHLELAGLLTDGRDLFARYRAG